MSQTVGSHGNSGQIIVPHPAVRPEPEDWGEVRQVEYPEANCVPVDVKNTVRVEDLPAKRSTMRSFVMSVIGTGAEPIEIIPGDPRIKNAWIQTDSNNAGNVRIGTQEQVKATPSSDAFLLGKGWLVGPLQGFETSTYAISDTAGNTIVNIRLEYWAD